jgi:flagellar FliL protein
MVFAVVPEINNVNSLVAKVAQAIDLDTSAGNEFDLAATIPIDQLASYGVNGGETMTVNLRDSADGKSHFIVASITLSINKSSEVYKTYSESTLSTYDAQIKAKINSIVSKYTIEEVKDDPDRLLHEIRDALNVMFGDNTIIADVGFASVTYQ